jgi:hypothetical protein
MTLNGSEIYYITWLQWDRKRGVDAAENLGFYALGSKNFGLDWSAITGTRTLRSDEPLAVELTAALKQGEVDRLRRLLAANPGLAHCVVENANPTSPIRPLLRI